MEQAYKFYSPEALRQRWNFLTGNPGFAGAIASSGDPATAAMEQRPGLASSTAAGQANDRNSLKEPTLQELPPLSHFSEDVQDQIKAIYAKMTSLYEYQESEKIAVRERIHAIYDDVRKNLPSSYQDGENEETDVIYERPTCITLDMFASGKSTMAEDVEGIANEFSDSESELSDCMQDVAMPMFGTADLDEIIAHLSRPQADVALLGPAMPTEAYVSCNSAREQGDDAHDTAPSDSECEQAYEPDLTAIWECHSNMLLYQDQSEKIAVRERIHAIYDDVRKNLPSSYEDGENEETDVIYERPTCITLDMFASGKSTMAEDVEDMANEFSDSESELSDCMQDVAMPMFGTADLDEIIADLSRP